MDDVIKGWEQRTRVWKSQPFNVHEQTVWTNNEGQDSPMNQGHDINYKYMTLHKRIDDDDSTLTPNGNKSISGESYGSSLCSCWVCGTEGHLSPYCSQIAGMDEQKPDSHTPCPHMMCVPPHAIPQLSNRQPLPQTDNSELKREVARVNKTEGFVKRLNHHEFDDEKSKSHINKEIEQCVFVRVYAMHIAPMRKIQESLIASLKENIQKEMLKNITVKQGRSLARLCMCKFSINGLILCQKNDRFITMENQHRIPKEKW